MGFRMRKSIKLGGGVRLNVSHKGVRGVSMRGKGGSVSVSKRGVTGSAGAKGIGYSKTVGWGGSKPRSAARRRAASPPPIPSPPKPGLFAPKHEKDFHKALTAYARGDTEGARQLFKRSSESDTTGRVLADDLLAGVLSITAGKPDEAIPHLETVVRSDVPLPDELMSKYGVAGVLKLDVTENVEVAVDFGSLAAALALAECYQEAGRIDEAIGLLQQLVEAQRDPAIVLSLCDLYAQQEAWDEVVDVAAGNQNSDDTTLGIQLIRARALREQGMDDAALEVLKDALRSKKRDAALLKEARYERGRLLLDRGKKTQASKDLQAVYAEDPQYRDVAELVRAM